MKTWIKRTLIGLFGAGIVVGGLTACGGYGHGYGPHTFATSEEDAARLKARMVERVGKHLDLNEPQKQLLGTLGDRLRDQRMALVGTTTDPRAQLKAIVAGTKFDRSKAQALVEEKVSALNTRSPAVLSAMADFYDSLTPEQQQKLRGHLEGRRGWFHRG